MSHGQLGLKWEGTDLHELDLRDLDHFFDDLSHRLLNHMSLVTANFDHFFHLSLDRDDLLNDAFLLADCRHLLLGEWVSPSAREGWLVVAFGWMRVGVGWWP